jgi:hypothetical protein
VKRTESIRLKISFRRRTRKGRLTRMRAMTLRMLRLKILPACFRVGQFLRVQEDLL